MPPETQAPEYIQKFRFAVEIDGIDDAIKFSEASGHASEFSTVEQAEGGRLTNRKRPGKRTFDDVTLKRGATSSLKLWEWHEALGDAASDKGVKPVDVRTVTVRSLDVNGETVRRTVFYEAWPARYVPGDHDAGDDGENAIEEVVLRYDRFKIFPG